MTSFTGGAARRRAAPPAALRAHEHGAVPPELVVFYSALNATAMRSALDAPELDYAWVLAHKEDQEKERLEEEAEAERAVAEQAREEADAAGLPRESDMVSPEVKYASQLAHLKDMGFADDRANLEALIETGGSIENAISHLFPS